jgi:ferredoxin
MAKTVRLEPIAQESSVETNSNLLSVLLNKDLDVLKECGGRGMCATCHIYVTEGMESLTPRQPSGTAQPRGNYLLPHQLTPSLSGPGAGGRNRGGVAAWDVRQLPARH